MRIIYSQKEFYELTKPIQEPALYNFPIELDSPTMWFFPRRFHELLDFCKRFPHVHIISTLSCTYLKVNKPLPNAMYYLLAEGDPDPDIIMIRKMSERRIQLMRIAEFDIDKRKAETTDFKSGSEP